MAVFNYSTRELTTKIVYYGPGLCGKTTNLQYVYENLPEGVRGKMLSLATKTDRTLFFDFLPIDLGSIHGMKTKVQLYTVPGQVFYNETRRLVLKGADGLVFVADSQENMIEANLDSFANLEENLSGHGIDLASTPHIIQYNKRDLPNAVQIEALNENLNKYNAPFYEAIATTGVGVQETLRHICKLVLIALNQKYGARPGVKPAASEAAQAAVREPEASGPVSVAPPAPPAGPAVSGEMSLGGAEALAEDEPSMPSAELIVDRESRAADLSLDLGDESPQEPPPPDAAAPPPVEDAEEIFALDAGVSPEMEDEPSMPSAAQFRGEAGLGGPDPLSDDEPFAAAGRGSRAAETLSIGSDQFPDARGLPETDEPFGFAPFDPGDSAAPSPPLHSVSGEDEDVFGLGPVPQSPWEDETDDAASLSPVGSAHERVIGVANADLAEAVASVVEVSERDPLFSEPGVVPTRLDSGMAQEILVPVEVVTDEGVRRYRLTLRLEARVGVVA
jgi:signal recognition particle receptor subunit beta